MVLWAAGYIFSSRDHSSIFCLIALHNRCLLFCSVAKSSPNICHPMDCIISGFPVLHHLLEFAQTQVHRVVVVQSLSHVQLFVTHRLQHARLPVITISRSLLKLMSIESVMPSNHLILCCPLLLPSIFPASILLSP